MQRPRVVIIGAGFGGLEAARRLARAPVDLLVVDRHNYHLFQPLLYQVATAGLAATDVAWPTRSLFRDRPRVFVALAEVTGIDPGRREIHLRTADPARASPIPYDYLIVATGVRHTYYGHPEWADAAPGLKTIEDAGEIRRRILLAFERAEMTEDPEERKRLLTFVVVGGGPTGVELAGAIIELARRVLAADFRRINTRETRVLLIEAGERILPAFRPQLSDYARRALEKLGVEVRTGQKITGCEAAGVWIEGAFQPAGTTLWAAGVQGGPVGRWLDAPTDPQGRIHVQPDLSVPGMPEIYVIGDMARVPVDGTGIVPGVAPAAKQMGRFVADEIARRATGAGAHAGNEPRRFRYRHQGDLATIGRHSAVVDFGWLRLRGYLAWWVWGIAHIHFLIGARSRLMVSIQWLWSYLMFQRGARLITGRVPPPPAPTAPPPSGGSG